VKAVECNLVEEDEQPVEFEDKSVRFGIKPYEIKTFKVWFA
jgi:alpha-mannosidase